MYIDENAKQGSMLNKTYELTEDIKPLCCNNILKKGEIVKVTLYSSRNRLLVDKNGSIHKIKRSSLNRIGKEINE